MELLRAWFRHDRLHAVLRSDDPAIADWPFEAMLPASPFALRDVFLSAADRNLGHQRECPGTLERLPQAVPAPFATAPRRLLRHLGRKQTWQVERLLSDPFGCGPVRTEPLIPRPGVLRADPFAIRVADKNWLLFEEQLPGDKGRLRAASQDGASWTMATDELLALPHHLSWPCVFEADGRIFMVPESGEAGEVALWECEDFPFRWRKLRVLLSGRPWHDPCLVRHEGLWWLFASAGGHHPSDHSAELCAFHSPDLAGPFLPHALNPLSVSVAGSRPAGQFFSHEGALHRPAQDCRGGYGSGVLIQRIERLTPHEWSERTVGRLAPPPGAVGLHTLNRLPDGGWVVDVI